MTTRSILQQIACKGYAVSLRRIDGKVHAEAILLSDPAQRHVSKSYDSDDEPETRRVVAALAKMVGVTVTDD